MNGGFGGPLNAGSWPLRQNQFLGAGMVYIYIIFMGSIFGLIPLAPMTALFQYARLKMDNIKTRKKTIPHILAAYIFCLALLAILSATGVPVVYNLGLSPLVNLVPFVDISTNPIHYLHNIFLFVPLGFLLPLLWKRFERFSLTVACGALFSLSIEALQLFCPRVTDIDDFLMNTAGTIAGYLMFMIVKKTIPWISIFSIDDTGRWKWEPYFYFAIAWLSMLFIVPYLSRGLTGPMNLSPGGEMPLII